MTPYNSEEKSLPFGGLLRRTWPDAVLSESIQIREPTAWGLYTKESSATDEKIDSALNSVLCFLKGRLTEDI